MNSYFVYPKYFVSLLYSNKSGYCELLVSEKLRHALLRLVKTCW